MRGKRILILLRNVVFPVINRILMLGSVNYVGIVMIKLSVIS